MGAGLFITIVLSSVIFGDESAFINPSARSDVKFYILDKDRQAEILELMKTYESEFNASRKKEKKLEKTLEKLFADRNSEIQDFQAVFDDYMQLRELRQLSYTKAVLRTKSIVTDTEWSSLLSGNEGRQEVQLNEQDKLISKIKTSNERIAADLKEWVVDDKKATQAAIIMKEVTSSETAILMKLSEFNYNDFRLLRDKNSTEEDYKKAFKEHTLWWNEYFELYTKAYLDLSALTTDEEWRLMEKYTKGIF
jgi:hypothetical protein